MDAGTATSSNLGDSLGVYVSSGGNSLLKGRNAKAPAISVLNGVALPSSGAKASTTAYHSTAAGVAAGARSATVISSGGSFRTGTVIAPGTSRGICSTSEVAPNTLPSNSHSKQGFIAVHTNPNTNTNFTAGVVSLNSGISTTKSMSSSSVSTSTLTSTSTALTTSVVSSRSSPPSTEGIKDAIDIDDEAATSGYNRISVSGNESNIKSGSPDGNSIGHISDIAKTSSNINPTADGQSEIITDTIRDRDFNTSTSIMHDTDNSLASNNDNPNSSAFEASNINAIESSAMLLTDVSSIDDGVNEDMTRNISMDEHTRDGSNIGRYSSIESGAGGDVIMCGDETGTRRNGSGSSLTNIGRSVAGSNAPTDAAIEQDSSNMSSDPSDPSSMASGAGAIGSMSTTPVNPDVFFNTAADLLYGTVLSAESIKVIAESVGISALPDDAAKEVAEDITIKIKRVVQDALKFMYHSKRERLLISDLDHALCMRNIEPQYGFIAKDFIPFRFASGGGRELHFVEEKDIDLADLLQVSSLKLPIEPTIRTHWLAVDGVQPTIPENPPPLSKEVQSSEAVNPIVKLDHSGGKDIAGKPAIGKFHKLRNVETVHVKQLATHELSVEQQLYYKEITEACVGADESRRGEALQSLACDPGLYEMLPRMCTFIAEGVKVNVVQTNLAILIYLMRMVKALLDNPTLYLEKYLHELIPSVLTCIVTRQLCTRPELDNHWALRDFASRLMSQICKTFNTSTNDLQTRITRVFSRALINDKIYLSSLYGSLTGLSELGPEVIKVFIIPRLKFISERLEGHFHGSGQSSTDKTAAGHIRAMLQKVCAPILKQMRQPPDLPEEYKLDFGVLGPPLCQTVMKLRNSGGGPTTPFPQTIPMLPSPYFPSMVARQSVGQYVTNKPISSPAISANRTALPSSCQVQSTPPPSQVHNTDDMDVCSLNTSNNYGADSANVSIPLRRGSGENFTASSIMSTNSNKNSNNKTMNNIKNNNIGYNSNNNKNNIFNTNNFGSNCGHNNNNTNNNSAGMNNSNNDNNSKTPKNNNINKNYNNNINTSSGVSNNRIGGSNDNVNNNSGNYVNSNKIATGTAKNVNNCANNNNNNNGTPGNQHVSASNKNPMNSPTYNPVSSPINNPINSSLLNHPSNLNVNSPINNPTIYGSNNNSNSSSNNNNSAGNARDNNGGNMIINNRSNVVTNSNPNAPHFNSNTFLRQSNQYANLHTVVVNNTLGTVRQQDSNTASSMDTEDQ